MAFTSNSGSPLENFNRILAEELDVKLFGKLTSFLDWEIYHNRDVVKVFQHRYDEQLLDRHGLHEENVAQTPFRENSDITSAQDSDVSLGKVQV